MNSRPLYYTLDENEQPVPQSTYARAQYAQTQAKDEWEQIKTSVNGHLVSTIFLGIDHNLSSKGDPVLWETMVFPTENDEITSWDEEYSDRYTSADDARKGHAKAVAWALNHGP
jgi:hypothetical protein